MIDLANYDRLRMDEPVLTERDRLITSWATATVNDATNAAYTKVLEGLLFMDTVVEVTAEEREAYLVAVKEAIGAELAIRMNQL